MIKKRAAGKTKPKPKLDLSKRADAAMRGKADTAEREAVLAKLNKVKEKRKKLAAVGNGKEIARNAAVIDKQITKLEETLTCIRLRSGGASYSDIARTIGISESQARTNVVEEMKRLNTDIQEEALEHRQLQLERINAMILDYWPKKSNVREGAMILALMNKQDDLLGIIAQNINLRVNPSTIQKMTDVELDDFLKRNVDALQKPVPLPTLKGGKKGDEIIEVGNED
jgi:transposase-like protein